MGLELGAPKEDRSGYIVELGHIVGNDSPILRDLVDSVSAPAFVLPLRLRDSLCLLPDLI